MVEAFLLFILFANQSEVGVKVKGYLHQILVNQRLLAPNLRIFFQLTCFRYMLDGAIEQLQNFRRLISTFDEKSVDCIHGGVGRSQSYSEPSTQEVFFDTP